MIRSALFIAVGALGIVGSARAQSMPFAQRTGGILVSDTINHSVVLVKDTNGDGVADTQTVFVDAANASGLITASSSFFAMYQAADGTVYLGENSSRSILACRDANANGTANDPGETWVWFSEAANANGYTLPTPNGLAGDASGAIYILNSGAGTTPVDAIYRTVDNNADGNANGASESSVWTDLSNLITPVNVSSAFDVTFLGNAAYFMDLRGGQTDVVYRAEDVNSSGAIDASELGVFVTTGDVVGTVTVQTGTASCVNDGSSIYVHQSTSSTTHRLQRLTDLNSNGVVDTGVGSTEAAEIWNASFLPAGFSMGNSFAIAVGRLLPGNAGPEFMAMSSNSGTHTQDLVILLHDLNGDLDFMDAGETTIFVQGIGTTGFPDNVRQLLFYGDVSTPTTSVCLGDNSGAALACPCGNNATSSPGSGCANPFFGTPIGTAGGILTSTGVAGASAGTDTLVLTATNLPGPCLFIQENPAPPGPLSFGDGILCSTNNIIRMGVVFSSGGVATYPSGVLLPIHVAGSTVSGDVRTYQAWYRSSPSLCNPALLFNMTQGLQLTWGP